MPRQKQFDVDAVLDKAMQTFWNRGYQATSMHDLVRCTGLHRGSLYAAYGDKRALFLAALRRYDDTVRDRLTTEFAERCSPCDAIRRVFMAFAAQEAGNSTRGCFLTNTALELAAHDEEVRRIVAHAQQQLEAFFVRMIEQGQQQEEIPPEIKPIAAGRSLLAAFLGLLVLTRSRPEPSLHQAIVNEALTHLVPTEPSHPAAMSAT